MIAVIVGVIAVVAIALLIFFSGSPSAGQSSMVPVTASPAASSTGASAAATAVVKTTPVVTGTSVVTIKATTPVNVPQEGVYVKVSYLGGYTGTYGVNGVKEKVTGSGDRIYSVNATGGTLQAAFQKRDGSTSHELVVDLVKGGNTLISKKNSSAYGIVSVSSPV